MRNLTPWGLEVRKRLLERSMSIEELAKVVGASRGTIIRDILYGFRPGKKYVVKIENFLGMSNKNERGDVVNE